MKTIITYGTFDLFHVGHLRLLERASKLGTKLIVAVSTDQFNTLKGKQSIIPYDQRCEIVAAIKYVDMVIPEMDWEQKSLDLINFNVGTFCIGDDWLGHFDFLKEYCEVVYLPRTDGINSTLLRSLVHKF